MKPGDALGSTHFLVSSDSATALVGATLLAMGPRSVLLTSALGLLAACGGPTSGSFEALTYNIAGLPEGISGSAPATNTPRISTRIGAYDLVLVQEDFSYHHLLIAAADHPHRSEPLAEFETFVNDGLNRLSRFPLGPMYRERWPACHGHLEAASDCLSSKGFSFSEVELADGVTVHVYNHHAEAGGSPEDDAAREAGYLRLAEEIAARSGAAAVIVGGDTNLDQDDPEDEPVLQAFMTATGLSDACRSLGCTDDRIDRFLFRSGGGLTVEALQWAVADEFVDAEGGPLSDHLAVRTTFGWSVD